MANQVWVNVNLEFEFHVVPKVKNSTLLTQDFVAFFAKQILLHNSQSEIHYNDLDLANTIYKYINLKTDADYLDPQSPDAWLWVLRSANQQWFYLRVPSVIIGRYVHLFLEVFKKDQALKDSIDLVLGMDILDAFKIGTCIFANFCPRKDGQFATSFTISSYTSTTITELRPLLTEGNIKKFLDIFAIDRDGFIEKNTEFSIKNPLLKKYEFNPLRRFPVIKTGLSQDGKNYIIPSIPDFLYACFEGMYYVLLDRLDEANKKKLFQELGGAFERYIGELIKYSNVDTFSKGKLFSEQTYRDGRNEMKSADWLIVSEKYIFQIECKKRKLDTLSKVGLEDKNKKGINSFLGDTAKELDKLVKKEKHIKENKIPTVQYAGQDVINIIVFLDEMFAINTYARKRIKEKMSEDSDNFYVLGCHEFELLCQHSKNASIDAKQALEDVLNHKTKIFKVDFLDAIYSDFFKKTAKNIPLI